MSVKRLVKKLLGCKGIAVDSVEIREVNGTDSLVVTAHLTKAFSLRDPSTGKRAPGYDSPPQARRWRHLDFADVPVYVEMWCRRIRCDDGSVKAESVPFARPGSRFTSAFEDQVAWMAKCLPKTAVSELMRIDWETVGSCIGRAVADWGKGADPLAGLANIGVDETSYKKGYKYMTVVVDHATKRVVWAHDGHGKDVLAEFFRELGPERCAGIRNYTADGARYISESFDEFCPKATRCLDPYHLVEWANEALDEIRRECWNEARKEVSKAKREAGKRKAGRPRKDDPEAAGIREAKDAADAIKGSKFALLKSPERLTEFQSAKLRFLAETQPLLYKAYELKELLRSATAMGEAGCAKAIDFFCFRCAVSKNEVLIALGEKVKRHREAILNTVRLGFTNAIVESTNGRIKKIIRMANGFRNVGNMISLIFLKLGGVDIPLPRRARA